MSEIAVPDRGVYGVLEWQDYNGAAVRRGATYREMFDAVELVVTASDRLQFTLGDMLVYVHDTFRHLYPQFVSDISRVTGKAESTLGVWEWTARNVKHGTRRASVSWGKHVLLSTLEEEQQHVWLDRIERDALTTRELKQQLVDAGVRRQPPRLVWGEPEVCYRCGRTVKACSE